MKELKKDTWYWLTNPQESDIPYPVYCNVDGRISIDGSIIAESYEKYVIQYLTEVTMPSDDSKQERDTLQLITERDHWEEKATELANDIGGMLGFDVGEHSNMNCPVQNAIDGVFEMTDTVTETLKAQ